MNKKTPEEIIKRLKELKSFIHANLPQCHFIISQIILRKDKPDLEKKGKILNDILNQV